jgi:hypothetical protein
MRTRLSKNLAAVGFDFAHNQLHQGRFARAIASEQTETFPGVYLEINVIEHRRTAEGLRDIEKTEKRHGKGPT